MEERDTGRRTRVASCRVVQGARLMDRRSLDRKRSLLGCRITRFQPLSGSRSVVGDRDWPNDRYLLSSTNGDSTIENSECGTNERESVRTLCQSMARRLVEDPELFIVKRKKVSQLYIIVSKHWITCTQWIKRAPKKQNNVRTT